MSCNGYCMEQRTTLRDYITDNIAETIDELCQYQNCDNCSIGALYEAHSKECILHKVSTIDAIDIPLDYRSGDLPEKTMI